MFYIVCSSQEGIRLCSTADPIRFELSDKQQHFAPAFPVVNIPLPCRRICRCSALTLPMEQALVDGVVLVHSGWRIVLISFIQRHKEHI